MLYPIELRAHGMAGEQGFEPRYYGPEPHVLPLDDSPRMSSKYIKYRFKSQFNFYGIEERGIRHYPIDRIEDKRLVPFPPAFEVPIPFLPPNRLKSFHLSLNDREKRPVTRRSRFQPGRTGYFVNPAAGFCRNSASTPFTRSGFSPRRKCVAPGTMNNRAPGMDWNSRTV
jgi:hypothetical protein